MRRDSLVSLFHGLSGAAAISVSLLDRPGPTEQATPLKVAGAVVFVLGMLLFAYAVAHLKRAFLGDVEPATDTLVTRGPYRVVRHPACLGMMVSALGLPVALRSLWSVLGTLLVFVPIGIYRAKLEDRALAEKFGHEWDAYARRTRFMLPLIC